MFMKLVQDIVTMYLKYSCAATVLVAVEYDDVYFLVVKDVVGEENVS